MFKQVPRTSGTGCYYLNSVSPEGQEMYLRFDQTARRPPYRTSRILARHQLLTKIQQGECLAGALPSWLPWQVPAFVIEDVFIPQIPAPFPPCSELIRLGSEFGTLIHNSLFPHTAPMHIGRENRETNASACLAI